MEKLDSNEKQAYQAFCDRMSSYQGQLNELFESNTTKIDDPEGAWRGICGDARTEIKQARMKIINMVGGKHHDEGVKWFRILMSIFAKLESSGTDAFKAKVDLDRLMAKKDKSLQRNRTIKKDYQEDIDYLDESMGFAESYLSTDDKEQWLSEFKDENSGKNFVREFADDASFAYNLGEAAVKGNQIASGNAKSDEPDRFQGGEKALEAWEIESEVFYFANFKNLRIYWQELIKEHHKEYEKLYEQWYNELDWIFQDSMLRGTENMSAWKWSNLGPKFMVLLDKM
jgi:hypothetical protein